MVIANQLFDALTAANVPRDQAHAVVDALEHRMTSELATKAEFALVKVDIVKLDAKIADLQLKLTVRMGGMMLGTAGLLFSALKYFGV